MSALVLFFIAIGLSFISAIVRGIVLSQLWTWFIIPTFAVPALPVVPAIGVSLFVSLLAPSPISDKEPTGGRLASTFILGLTMSALTYFLGWVWSLAL